MAEATAKRMKQTSQTNHSGIKAGRKSTHYAWTAAEGCEVLI